MRMSILVSLGVLLLLVCGTASAQRYVYERERWVYHHAPPPQYQYRQHAPRYYAPQQYRYASQQRHRYEPWRYHRPPVMLHPQYRYAPRYQYRHHGQHRHRRGCGHW